MADKDTDSRTERFLRRQAQRDTLGAADEEESDPEMNVQSSADEAQVPQQIIEPPDQRQAQAVLATPGILGLTPDPRIAKFKQLCQLESQIRQLQTDLVSNIQPQVLEAPSEHHPVQVDTSIVPPIVNEDFVTSVQLAQRFRLICKKGSGTFADVWKCQDTKSGKQVACKRMKQSFSSVEQAENLREIIALRKIRGHENILNLHEVVYERKSGRVVLVFELMDMNLYELIQSRHSYFVDGKVQHFMYQLCKALDYLHRHGIFHRDIKPENILIKGDLLKLGDFGSCRLIGSRQPYTEYISTRWYRPPECLLTNGSYTYKMDVWGSGCVFFEIVSLKPLFPGSNEVDQVACIHRVLGTADRKTMQKFTKCKSTHIKYDFPPEVGVGIDAMLPSHTTDECRELLKLMCRYDPEERITARQALAHSFFRKYRKARRRESRAASLLPSAECPLPSLVAASPSAKAMLHEAEAVNLELRPLHDSRPIIRKLKCHTHKSSHNLRSTCSSNGTCMTGHSSKTTADSILPTLDLGSTTQKPKRQKLSPAKSQSFLPVIKRKL